VSGGTAERRETVGIIREGLLREIGHTLQVDPATLNPAQSVFDWGPDSLAMVTLVGRVEEWLELDLPVTVVWDYPTVQALSEYLATQVSTVPVPARADGRH
jgi:acyl carrier protein